MHIASFLRKCAELARLGRVASGKPVKLVNELYDGRPASSRPECALLLLLQRVRTKAVSVWDNLGMSARNVVSLCWCCCFVH